MDTAREVCAFANDSRNCGSPNNPLKKLRNTYKKKIETYIQVVEHRADKLSNRDRSKVESMIIMEEHNRDVIDKLFARMLKA